MQIIAAAKEGPQRGRETLHYALGKAYADLKNHGEAIKHYDAANEITANWLRVSGLALNRDQSAAQTDRTVATFTAELFRKNADLGVASELPILIVGMIRSGTTLMECPSSKYLRQEVRFFNGGSGSSWVSV